MISRYVLTNAIGGDKPKQGGKASATKLKEGEGERGYMSPPKYPQWYVMKLSILFSFTMNHLQQNFPVATYTRVASGDYISVRLYNEPRWDAECF